MAGSFSKSALTRTAGWNDLLNNDWVAPAAVVRRRDYFKMYKVLPPGMPDCLDVSILHTEEGTERCTAAIYGGHAYLIHYEFKRHEK